MSNDFQILTVQVLIPLKELNHFRYDKICIYNALNFALTLLFNVCTTVHSIREVLALANLSKR